MDMLLPEQASCPGSAQPSRLCSPLLATSSQTEGTGPDSAGAGILGKEAWLFSLEPAALCAGVSLLGASPPGSTSLRPLAFSRHWQSHNAESVGTGPGLGYLAVDVTAAGPC